MYTNRGINAFTEWILWSQKLGCDVTGTVSIPTERRIHIYIVKHFFGHISFSCTNLLVWCSEKTRPFAGYCKFSHLWPVVKTPQDGFELTAIALERDAWLNAMCELRLVPTWLKKINLFSFTTLNGHSRDIYFALVFPMLLTYRCLLRLEQRSIMQVRHILPGVLWTLLE